MEKRQQEKVMALIEVKISPEAGFGYDRVAQRIYEFKEVDSLYLIAGSYDLLVTMTATSMTDVAAFVAEHLASIEGVTGCTTHSVMKTYKEQGRMFCKSPEQEERIGFV